MQEFLIQYKNFHRKGLPLHYLRHTGRINENMKNALRNKMLEEVDNLFNKLKKYVSIDDAADRLGRRFMYDSMPPYVYKNEKYRTSKYDGEYLINGQLTNRFIKN